MKDEDFLPNEHCVDDSGAHILCGWRYKAMLFVVLASAIGYILIGLWGGWHEVIAAAIKVGVFGIVLALGLSLVNYFLRFIRWQHYLKLLGYHVPWWHSLRIYIAGFALTVTPGKTGEILRSVFLKNHGVTYRHSIGALVSERFSDLISAVLIVALGLWHYPQARPAVIILSAGIGIALLILQKVGWLRSIKKFADTRFPVRFSSALDFFIEIVVAFRSCYKIRTLFYGITIGIIAWGAEAIAFYYLLVLLDTDVGLLTAVFIYTFSLLVGVITFLPAGLGGTEVIMLELLSLSGVSLPDAVACTLVIRVTTLWFSVILGVAALPRRRSIKRKS